MTEQTGSQTIEPIWNRRSVWAFILLAIVCVLAPAFGDMNEPTFISATYLASIAAACAGMGFWLGFGESVGRFAIVPLGLCLVTFCMTIAFGSASETLVYGIFCFMTAILVGAPIAFVRMVRRGHLRLKSQTPSNIESSEVLRFNIRHIFVFMTAIAVLSAIGKATLSMSGGNYGIHATIAGTGATLGICSVVVVWATLGSDPLMRNIVSVFVAIVLSLSNAFLVQRGAFSWIWVTVTMAVWLEMTILMWLLRSDGYRFVVASEPE